MDHLGIDEFLFIGYCIGGPFALKLIERAPQRVAAAVLCQPVGHNPKVPDAMYDSGLTNWAPEICARRPEVTMEIVEQYLHNLYRVQPDFMYSVSKEFARSCQTPMLVMPDDTPAHSYEAAMELAAIAPKAQVTVYPWKEEEDVYARTVEQVREFLLAHQPTGAAKLNGKAAVTDGACAVPAPGGLSFHPAACLTTGWTLRRKSGRATRI